jgi:putative two-component system response regulator
MVEPNCVSPPGPGRPDPGPWKALVQALASLIESRDAGMEGHLERTATFCGLLAERLAADSRHRAVVDAAFIQDIVDAGPLHDIGKAGLPDEVRFKVGRLTPDEFETMKGHTLLGEKTLREVGKGHPGIAFLEMAATVARSHHERWDGAGYPDGLAGQAIPLSARIMAVADVYDALGARRVYMPTLTHQEICDLICLESGHHFDPDVVQAFLEAADAFQEISARMRES